MSAPAPRSPVHKRRRVAPDHPASAESAAAELRDAVRAAVADAPSPTSRHIRINAVYASFRQRAITSNHNNNPLPQPQDEQQKHSNLHPSHPDSACSHGPASACCTPTRGASPAPSCAGSPASSQPGMQQQQATGQPPPSQSQQQSQQSQQTQDSNASQQSQPSGKPPPAEEQDNSPPPPPKTAPPGVFPGKGARAGCEHYARNCWIKAACCGKYYACRRCHDEAETHEIDRHATELVACVVCGDADQPVASHCRSCGVRFARYFCSVCKFYEDRPGKDAYHCVGCGICRVGKGIGIDNYHCDKCGNCVPIASKDDHPCVERSHDSNCPICTEHLGSSVEQVVFMRCGHSIHVDCLNRHAQTSFKCPICQKCLTDMSSWYRQLDERLARDVMPPELARRRSRVYCHDCELESTARFHFVYHKCGSCGGYNTRVLSQFDVAEEDDASSGGGSARAAVTAARRAALPNPAVRGATM